jgi:hypothetical protein
MKPFSILTLACTTLSLLTACSPFSSSVDKDQDVMGDEQGLSAVRQDGPYLDDMDEDESAVELRVGSSGSSLAQPKL